MRRVRRADGQLAVLERPDGRGDAENLRDVERVLDDDQREAAPFHEAVKRGEDRLRLALVESRQRFVQEQHVRPRADGADHRDELRFRDLGVRA